MVIFEDIDDVKEWLGPLDYAAFWKAVEPYGIFPAGDREHCDERIASGKVAPDLVLECLKAMARTELTQRLDLNYRVTEPVDAQYLKSTH